MSWGHVHKCGPRCLCVVARKGSGVGGGQGTSNEVDPAVAHHVLVCILQVVQDSHDGSVSRRQGGWGQCSQEHTELYLCTVRPEVQEGTSHQCHQCRGRASFKVKSSRKLIKSAC